MPVAPWLDNTPVVPVTQLSADELLDAWASHRNDFYGIMAAEEIMKRLHEHRARAPGSLSAVLGVRQVLSPSGTQQS